MAKKRPPEPEPKATRPNRGLVRADRIPARIAWLSDLHVPYHDAPAIDAALDFLRSWRPELVVLGGDLFDCYGISRFDKDPERDGRVQDEFDAARPLLKRIDALKAEVVYVLGNHEDRLARLIQANPALSRLRALEFGKAAELPPRWTVLANQAIYRVGHLSFLHGDLRGQRSGGKHVAANLLGRLKTSCLFGHFHRQQSHFEPSYDGTVRAAFACGHLCDVESAAEYIAFPDWTTGFASIDMDPASGLFEVRSHTISGGKFRFSGRTYGG